jgi:DNA repair protein RecO (recombination protein O)
MMHSASRDRLYRTEAVILRRQNFGEADKLLTLFTPGLGKKRVLAKGVRKPKSRKGGHVELFTHTNLLIAKGRNLDIVTQAETIRSFLPIRRELARTSYAYYAVELLDRFTEEGEENKPLFELLLDVLSWISEERDLDLTLRYFELHLLGHAGYRPQLFQCLGCLHAIESEPSFFSPTDGGLLCSRCLGEQRGVQELSQEALAILRHLQTREYASCRRLQIEPIAHQELETVMRHYIVYLLERKLKSVDFIDALKKQGVVNAPTPVEYT